MEQEPNESKEAYAQRLHETTWRRGTGQRVLLSEMGEGELQTVIDNLETRIRQEEDKLLTDPKYENLAQANRANKLIRNSQDKLIYLRQELNKRNQ